MSARSLGQEVLSAMPSSSSFSSSSPNTISSMIAQKLTTYILVNCKLVGVYNGTIPGTPPIPEVMIPDTWSVSGNISSAITSSAGFNPWLTLLDTNIKAGIFTGMGAYCSPMAPMPAFPALSTQLQQSELESIVKAGSDVAIKSWELIFTRIFMAIKLGFVPSVPARSTPGGIGNFTVTSIILE